MRKTVSLVLVLAIAMTTLLCGCGEKPKTSGEFTLAETPSPETQAQIDDVLSKFMQCYEQDDAAGAMALIAESFEATEEDMKSFFSEMRDMVKNPFVPYDTYYIDGLTVSDTLIKVKHAKTDTDYIELVPAQSELCCAFYVSEGEKISYAMSFMLIREGDGFKITNILPGIFSYEGENAPAIFEKTKTAYTDGKLIAAYIYSCMLGSSLRPGGYMRYENDIEMEDMCYKLFSEISENVELPLALKNTANSSIHQISIVNDSELGVMPLLLVKTDTPVSDSKAIEAECQRVLDALELLSPGLRGEFSYAHIKVTNDTVDESNPEPSSETVIIPLK